MRHLYCFRAFEISVCVFLMGTGTAVFAQTVTATISVGTAPMAAAVNPISNKIYVANSYTNNVTVIDGATNETTTVPAGAKPYAVAVNPVTDKIYVPNYGSNNVTVIDGATNETTTVPAGAEPYAVAVNPVTDKIYVANFNSNNVTIIDGATNDTTVVTAGTNPVAIAVDPVTDKIYVANNGSANVTVIDGATDNTSTVTCSALPLAIAVDPVTNRIYVANSGLSSFGIKGNVTVIDGATNGTITDSTGVSTCALSVNPVTDKIYVANSGSNYVTVIDGVTNGMTTVSTGNDPYAIAVDPVTNKIYVANDGINPGVTVIDGATNTASNLACSFPLNAIAVNPIANKTYAVSEGASCVIVVDGATNSTTTVSAGTNPQAVAVNPITDKIYVANNGSADVTVIDGVTNNVTGTVACGVGPQEVAVNPVTDKIYVANGAGNNVTVIDGATDDTTTVPAGNWPRAMAVDPVTNKIYVANYSGNNVTVIDGATNSTVTVSTGSYPRAVAVNPVTDKIYVANFNSNNVTIIDGATNSTTTVPAGTSPIAIAVDPVTDKIYVANYGGNTVTVIDGATNSTTTVSAGSEPVAVAINPVMDKIYVANYGGNNVTVIDGATNSTATVSAGTHPIAIAVNPVTDKIYVANANTISVTVIDGATNSTVTVSTGSYPQAVAVNPVTDKIYVANESNNNATVLTEQSVQPVPLATSISALTDNETMNVSPTFNLSASSSYSPTAPSVQGVYYAVDTWQDGWQKASGSGSSYSCTTGTLSAGTHVIYAFATDGQEATSVNTGYGASPIIGGIKAYAFDVVAPPVPALTSPANNAVNQPVDITLQVDPSSGATSYHWQVSTSPTFSSMVVDNSTTNTTNAVTLSFGTEYYWRVQAVGSAGASVYSATYSFTTIAPPHAPTLAYPLNNAVNQPVDITLQVDPSSGATSYHWQVSLSPTFSSTVVDNTTTDTTNAVSLSMGMEYYWRVQAVNIAGSSSYSEPDSFKTMYVQAPPTPTLSYPANNATGIPTGKVILKWDETAPYTTYVCMLSANPGFSPILVQRGQSTATSFEVDSLSPYTEYYWRICGYGGGDVSLSLTDSFRTAVGVPIVLSPVDSAMDQPSSVTLEVDSVTGATGYHWQVATDTAFSGLVVDDSTSGVGDTVQVVTLKNDVKYYWHAQAFGIGGAGPYTASASFTTIIAAPLAPKPAYPIGTTGEPRIAVFRWDPSANAVRYHFQVAGSDSLDSLEGFMRTYVVFDTTLSDTTDTLSTPLQADVKYYWHVSAIDTGGESPYSAVETFTTGVGLTGIDEMSGVEKEYRLYQNYPNPFNPTTAISYRLSEASHVTLKVYDILGREVATLVDGEQDAGSYNVTFNGAGYASGVYFYRIIAEGTNGKQYAAIKKFMLMK